MRAKRRGPPERPAALRTDELRICGRRLRSAPLATCTFRGCRLSFRRGHQFLSTGETTELINAPYAICIGDNAPLAPASGTCLFAVFYVERANHCSSVDQRTTSEQINVDPPLDEPQHRVRFLVALHVGTTRLHERCDDGFLVRPAAGDSRRRSLRYLSPHCRRPRLGSRPYLHD